MKKILSIVVLAAGVVLPFAFSSNAFAASCPVGFTGPNSANICTSVTAYQCSIKNDTTVDVVNQNVQIAVSGNAAAGGAGSVGDVKTGSATNSNGTTFTAKVTNGACTVAATVPATPTPTPTPTQAPTKQTVTAPKPASAAALPDTSSSNAPLLIGGSIALLGAAAVATRVAIATYGRAKS